MLREDRGAVEQLQRHPFPLRALSREDKHDTLLLARSNGKALDDVRRRLRDCQRVEAGEQFSGDLSKNHRAVLERRSAYRECVSDIDRVGPPLRSHVLGEPARVGSQCGALTRR